MGLESYFTASVLHKEEQNLSSQPTTSRYYSFFQTLEMTSFKYEPISLEGPAFRLLRLLKGDDDPIQCQLFESRLPPPEDIGDYVALSYTWGSEYRPCEVMINGNKMAITKNAYLALRDLRYRGKDRLIWIDALSIDQNNDKERGEQVQQMVSIYSKAKRVIVWLGEATYDTNYAMYYVEQLAKEVEHASNSQRISETQLVNIWSIVVHNLNADQRGLLVEGLQSLLHRNWFKRVWIIQEIASAQVGEINCGGKSVPASIFALMPFLLEITPDLYSQPILDIMLGPLPNSSWWVKERDLRTLLVKFCKSEATDPRDRIYAMLGISSDACNTDFLKADYEKDLRDVIFDTVSFLLNLNKLESPVRRFFDWTFPQFSGNLNFLAMKVLECAMDAEHEAVVRLLLVRDDVDINMRESGPTPTPLLWAAKQGHEAVVKLLLENGAELDIQNNFGETSLFCAAWQGHEAVVKLLLKNGAGLDIHDRFSGTPLLEAARRGHEGIVKLLLENSAKLETKDDLGLAPLSWAAREGHEETVKLLLENSAERETKDNLGQTPLLWASGKGHKAVVKLLLDNGAERETKDNLGQTPLFWAIAEGHEAIEKLLLKNGAEVSQMSPLARALSSTTRDRRR